MKQHAPFVAKPDGLGFFPWGLIRMDPAVRSQIQYGLAGRYGWHGEGPLGVVAGVKFDVIRHS